MKKLKRLLIILIALVVALVLIGMILPSKWQVQRSVVINVAPYKIYPYVSNFKTGWPQWSAFDTEDKNIQYSYSGPIQGLGATRSWISKSMGNGTQKITKADVNQGVEFELVMTQNGFVMVGSIVFEPQGNATKVTWTDKGDVGGKIFFRYMSRLMDKMMGKTFETSLAALKNKLEK